MKTTKYVKLLTDANTTLTTIDVTDQQLKIFADHAKTVCTDINKALGNITMSKSIFEQTVNPLEKDVKKQAKQFGKSIETVEKNSAKIHKAIENEQNMEPIKDILENINRKIAECKIKLNASLSHILKCETNVANMAENISILDLPSDIDHATKQVDKITKELANIQLHITNKPERANQYALVMSPLRNAILSLAKSIEDPPAVSKAAPMPSLKP